MAFIFHLIAINTEYVEEVRPIAEKRVESLEQGAEGKA